MLLALMRPLGVAVLLFASVDLAIGQAPASAPGSAAGAPPATALSETDFLTDMPIVLSVSRLPQRLDETPGAVTIIDRDMIRLSGARDVADLLRLVPGFQTSTTFETGAPLASYHGGFDGYSARIQVLVDGRSVYSPYFFGGTATGLQSVALADIERIEVLRGSNSAAYGARAMLGVINIVTRHTVDTLGGQANVATGENGIRDAQASIGWGGDAATFRLGLDRRADDGLSGSNGHNLINRVNFRADLRASARDEIELRLGGFTIDSGKGFPSKVNDPPRDRFFGSNYLQLDWRRSLAADEDMALSVSRTEETYRDNFLFAPIKGLKVDSGGSASNDTILLQHTSRHGADVRVVVGGELRRERVVSRPLYNTDAALVTDFTRLFGNLEWRFAKDLLLNAGAMAENSSNGDSLAPRLMLNWHATDSQTLRAGVSRAYRPPSAYEKYGDTRYYLNGKPVAVITLASGTVQQEDILVRELGYLGDFPGLQLNLDVRAFHEKMGGFVRGTKKMPRDFVNDEDFTIQGLEYQLKWRPWRGGELGFSQAFIDINSVDPGTAMAAPRRASSLSLLQKLPGGLDLSLTHQDNSTARGQGTGVSESTSMTRTDLRLGVPLRVGRNRGEMALVLQNLGSPYQDYAGEFMFQHRAFVTLQLED